MANATGGVLEANVALHLHARAGLLSRGHQDRLHRAGAERGGVLHTGLPWSLLPHWFDLLRHGDDESLRGNVTDDRSCSTPRAACAERRRASRSRLGWPPTSGASAPTDPSLRRDRLIPFWQPAIDWSGAPD